MLTFSAINVSGTSFSLNTPSLSYRFHVSQADPVPEGSPIPLGELVHDHFGSPSTENVPDHDSRIATHAPKIKTSRRELGDLGRGDFRLPAIHLRHEDGKGHTVSHFTYKSHEVLEGKPKLEGLPATWGKDGEVKTLRVKMVDERSGVEAVLSYSVFPSCDAIARSIRLENKGKAGVTIERLASWCTDMDVGEWEMVQLCGEWIREGRKVRRPVYPGTQG